MNKKTMKAKIEFERILKAASPKPNPNHQAAKAIGELGVALQALVGMQKANDMFELSSNHITDASRSAQIDVALAIQKLTREIK